MMAGNPSWWSMRRNMRPQDHNQTSAFLPPCPSLLPQYGVAGSSNPLPLNSSLADNQEQFPHSWSQSLVDGLASEEDKFGVSHFQLSKKVENWEDQILNPIYLRGINVPVVDVKQEAGSKSSQLYCHGDDHHELIQTCRPCWSQVMPLISSPRSSVTSLGSNILDFSSNKEDRRIQHPDHSSHEGNSTATGGVSKKARVQSSSSQLPLKVRKEKLGDRVTALHQLVSPFGKTDTASVLQEAIGYIRFLEGQIEALSSPYLCNASTNMRHHQQSVQGQRDCTFTGDSNQGNTHDVLRKDLRSRGLCLVPVSCTDHHVGSSTDNGADYWAPTPGGGF